MREIPASGSCWYRLERSCCSPPCSAWLATPDPPTERRHGVEDQVMNGSQSANDVSNAVYCRRTGVSRSTGSSEPATSETGWARIDGRPWTRREEPVRRNMEAHLHRTPSR